MFDDKSDIPVTVADWNMGTAPKPLLSPAIDGNGIRDSRKNIGKTLTGPFKRILQNLAAFFPRRETIEDMGTNHRLPRQQGCVKESLVHGNDVEIPVHHQEGRGKAIEDRFEIQLSLRLHRPAPRFCALNQNGGA